MDQCRGPTANLGPTAELFRDHLPASSGTYLPYLPYCRFLDWNRQCVPEVSVVRGTYLICTRYPDQAYRLAYLARTDNCHHLFIG